MTEFSVAIEIITIKPNGAQSNSQQPTAVRAALGSSKGRGEAEGAAKESHLVAAAKRVCRQMADTFRPSWTDLDGAQARADNQNPFESEMSEINMTLAAPRAAHTHTHTGSGANVKAFEWL